MRMMMMGKRSMRIIMMMVMNHCMILFAYMIMTRMLTETVVISDNSD